MHDRKKGTTALRAVCTRADEKTIIELWATSTALIKNRGRRYAPHSRWEVTTHPRQHYTSGSTSPKEKARSEATTGRRREKSLADHGVDRMSRSPVENVARRVPRLDEDRQRARELRTLTWPLRTPPKKAPGSDYSAPRFSIRSPRRRPQYSWRTNPTCEGRMRHRHTSVGSDDIFPKQRSRLERLINWQWGGREGRWGKEQREVAKEMTFSTEIFSFSKGRQCTLVERTVQNIAVIALHLEDWLDSAGAYPQSGERLQSDTAQDTERCPDSAVRIGLPNQHRLDGLGKFGKVKSRARGETSECPGIFVGKSVDAV
ncbi:hypothetical protein C8J57DRAFT_1474062 [Mycena rebaudengoi]|nr:hypothetical protein C8J57DRAFT_1474062 [Mycena rebaudengoi]